VGAKGARGCCHKHYQRLRRTGHPEFELRAPVRERFARYENHGGPDECWEWTGGCDEDGYGNLWVDGTQKRASRLAWEYATGTPPGHGILVCHQCDNPPCVNPAHLFLGTILDNNRDKMAKGRWRGTSDPWTHVRRLTDEQVAEIRAIGNPYRGARRELAERYGVSQQHVAAIQKGQRR
jgi:hypothetical protein